MIAFYFKLKSSYYFVNRVEEMQAGDQSSSWHKGKLRFCKEVGWESRLQTFWLQSPLSSHSETRNRVFASGFSLPASGPTPQLLAPPTDSGPAPAPGPVLPLQAPPRRLRHRPVAPLPRPRPSASAPPRPAAILVLLPKSLAVGARAD